VVTVIGMWEPGFSDYEQIIEWRMWKQAIMAYEVDHWLMVGPPPKGGVFNQYDTLQEALDAAVGKKVFLIPSADLDIDEVILDEYSDIVFIFGNTPESMARYVGDDLSLSINIPNGRTHLFAVTCLPLVLHGLN